jgi:YidC/Oxa1 family membrane protein insertase
MALYREAGVNPMAGCIPQLIQFPILIALFRFFPSAFELRQQPFWWADDLSTYDSVMQLPFNIPMYGSHISLFTLLMAISMFAYTKYNMSNQVMVGAQAQQMKIMTYMSPFMMLVFFNSYSAGLSLYYLTSNLVTIGQQFAIRKWFVDEDKIHAELQENKKKPKKKSRFAAAMENMQEQQEAQNRKMRRQK